MGKLLKFPSRQSRNGVYTHQARSPQEAVEKERGMRVRDVVCVGVGLVMAVVGLVAWDRISRRQGWVLRLMSIGK